MRRKLVIPSVLVAALGAALASAQAPEEARPARPPSAPALPAKFKGPLGPMPLMSGASTHDLIKIIEDAIERGRAAHQASLDFDERYRLFVGALRVHQQAGSPQAVCKSPEAAKAYLEGSARLAEFKARRAEFAALLPPLRAARDNREALTPARRGQIERVLAYDEESSELEPKLEALFFEQMQGEIEALGCSEEALAKVSKEKPKLAALYTPPANTKPGRSDGSANQLPPASPARVPFTINNVDCNSPFLVVMDGEPVGTASANGVTSFSATAGWHSLCLAAEGDPEACNSRSSGVRTYVYEGWWIRAQCPSR
jgi:hypothetical protein